VEASKIRTTDPQSWVISKAQAKADIARVLHKRSLDFDNAGILIAFSEDDLSIDALLEVMKSRGLFAECGFFDTDVDHLVTQTDIIKNFTKRQRLETSGGVLLADRQIQMRGQSQYDMVKRVAAIGKTVIDTIGTSTAIQLGVVLNLQLYNQSEDVRKEMRDSATYTPDITAKGYVAQISNRYGCDQACVGGFDEGIGTSLAGSRVAVVKRNWIY